MRTLITILSVLVMSVCASQVDPLSAFEYARPQTPGLQYSIGVLYGFDHLLYDREGERISPPGEFKSNKFMVPLRLGYGFGSTFSAGVVVPFYVRNDINNPDSNTGFANPWVWLSTSFTGDCGSSLTPRLGFKVPFASYTLEDAWNDEYQELELGDKSPTLDLALLYAYRPTSSNLRLDAQASASYSFEATYMYNGMMEFSSSHGEGHETPGATIALALAPGLAYGENKQWESYLTLAYNAQISDYKSDFFGIPTSTVSSTEVRTSGMQSLTAGLRQDLIIAKAGTLHAQVAYDVLARGGKRVVTDITEVDSFTDSDYQPGGFTFGLGYTGYLALN